MQPPLVCLHFNCLVARCGQVATKMSNTALASCPFIGLCLNVKPRSASCCSSNPCWTWRACSQPFACKFGLHNRKKSHVKRKCAACFEAMPVCLFVGYCFNAGATTNSGGTEPRRQGCSENGRLNKHEDPSSHLQHSIQCMAVIPALGGRSGRTLGSSWPSSVGIQ